MDRMPLSGDEQILLFAAIGYLVTTGIWAISMSARARTLLHSLSEQIDPELWRELGAPTTVKAAMMDPQRRWYRFVQSGDYRRRCNDTVIEMIQDFRSRATRMLVILAVAGVLLLYRFWPLLKPDFL